MVPSSLYFLRYIENPCIWKHPYGNKNCEYSKGAQFNWRSNAYWEIIILSFSNLSTVPSGHFLSFFCIHWFGMGFSTCHGCDTEQLSYIYYQMSICYRAYYLNATTQYYFSYLAYGFPTGQQEEVKWIHEIFTKLCSKYNYNREEAS